MLLLGASNLSMTDGNVIILYNDSNGYVHGLWSYHPTNNISTAVSTDGKLEIGGEVVAIFDVGEANLAAALIEDPSFSNTGAGPLVYEVDVPASPTDVQERTDGGKDPDYEYEAP